MANPVPQANMPMPPMWPTPPTPQQPIQQPPVRPQQTANITKPASRISMKTVLIGCGILFMFVIGWLALVFYNLINNPTQLSSVGLDPTTTKTLLQTFSVIFFGLLTFLGIWLLVVNLYRLITVKNKKKTGYIFGAFFGFILFIFAIVIGARIITMVNNFSVDSILDSNNLIMPYLQLKDGVKNIHTTTDLKLIAPATMFYAINADYTSRLSSLGQVMLQEIDLDCWNDQNQKLKLNFNHQC